MSIRSSLRGSNPTHPYDPDLTECFADRGITLREDFAVRLMVALVRNEEITWRDVAKCGPEIARGAAELADALLEELHGTAGRAQRTRGREGNETIDLALPVDSNAIKDAFDSTKKGGVS